VPVPLSFGIESQGTSVRAMGDLAAAAERVGIDAAWAPELYDRSATISVAEMAHRTERCRVGTAIAYGVGRSPLTLAAEARDLDEISGGRFVLGIGNGTRRMIADWHGQDPEAPAKRIEELVPLLRDLWRLHEAPVDHEGRFYRLRMAPTGAMKAPLRERIPVWTAGVNPRMIESAGRVADGLLGHALFTAEHIAEVVRPVIGVVAAAAARARREPAAQIAFYCSAKSYGALLESHGFGVAGAAIREAFAAGDWDAMVAAVTSEMVDRMALAGTPDEVKAAARRYEGVLDHLILYAPSYGVSDARAVENADRLVETFGTPGGAAGTPAGTPGTPR
jgi:alkanesulfonate monooxygenase SsuD/methylene tetrahydromethanopterin reductase-like flavin-dependent oxidoreductase (luciferase family)